MTLFASVHIEVVDEAFPEDGAGVGLAAIAGAASKAASGKAAARK
jgi:hypothetical protein